MSSSIPDPLPAVLAELGAAALAGVEGRIYGERLPTAVAMDATETNRPARQVVVGSAGGGADWYVPLGRPRLALRAYGPTLAAARALWYAANGVLHDRTITRAGVRVVPSLNGGPNPGIEPDSGFPMVESLYDLMTVRV